MKTFFMIKPDGVKRNIIGDVVNRVEKEDFVITKMKMMQISTELAEMHYAEHSEKPFFGDLVTFITSGPVVAMQVEGDNAVLA
ncbi:MAG: nucleoside-diphosphate kinase, partial [Candidatus Actinomarina sp.]|nr:nucleoside-diphosphate kinase [Candidatus Actinomarina sp.]